MMSINLSDVAILKIKTVDYYCTISEVIKSEAINLMQNIDLKQEGGTL